MMGQRGKREEECQLDCADVSMLSGSVPGSASAGESRGLTIVWTETLAATVERKDESGLGR